jgi:predicted TIM-barrel fold metal-dependent hydrolase
MAVIGSLTEDGSRNQASLPSSLKYEDPNGYERLRYWVREHGFRGMRFSPIYHPKSTRLNSKEQYPLWREAEKLGAVFNFCILPHQMPMLEDMAERFPGVKIVIDHAGSRLCRVLCCQA